MNAMQASELLHCKETFDLEIALNARQVNNEREPCKLGIGNTCLGKRTYFTQDFDMQRDQHADQNVLVKSYWTVILSEGTSL